MALGDLILNACKTRGQSLASVCKTAKLRYSTLHSQISNKREIPFSTVDRLANALELSLSHFSEFETPDTDTDTARPRGETLQAETAHVLSELMAKQVAAMAEMGYQIGTDDVLDWLTANEGKLRNHSWLIDRVNLYYPLADDDTVLRPYHLGTKSLTYKYFQLAGVEDYASMFASFDADTQKEVLDAHRQAAGQTYLITDKRIDSLNESGKRVAGTYRRLLAPVVTTGDQRLIMSFSKLTHFSTG